MRAAPPVPVDSGDNVQTRAAPPIPALVGAVHVAPVTGGAEVEHPPATVPSTLNLPQIVHSRAGPPTTRPRLGRCATRPTSNASTRGDPGLEGIDFGPLPSRGGSRIVRRHPIGGQLPSQDGLVRFQRIVGLDHGQAEFVSPASCVV